jgi:hypothetical protein
VLFSSRMSVASVCWVRILSFYYGAIATAPRRFCIRQLRTFSMHAATIVTQTLRGGLLPVGSGMSKVVAVVAMRKASLSSV